jgi:membrane dipeptidase
MTMSAPEISPEARRLHDDALVWDAHACLPLHPDCDVAGLLARHRAAGAAFVSVNVGMDMNPLSQILPVIASFRAQIAARPDLLVQVDTAADVERAKREGRLAVAFDLEGGIPLCGRPESVQLFRDLGVRQIHLAYNRNNELAGGCYDEDAPLTPLGRRVVEAVHRAGMLMDVSHTGHRASLDIMGLGAGPVIFSHANPRAVRHDLRNATDEQIDACAATGGIVCVNGVGRFLTDPKGGTPAILDCVDHLADRIGARRVGLGIDYSYPAGGLDDDPPPPFDRAYWWPPEHGYGGGITGIRIAAPEQLPEITDGLLRRGYAEADVRAILGLNMLELARRVWRPASGPAVDLRRATPEDLPWIAALERREDFRSYLCAWSGERHAANLEDPDKRYLVAAGPGGVRLGFVILSGLASPERSVELVRMALAEPGRGVGREVLRQVAELAFGELGAARLWLDVFDDNGRALRAYRAAGFREEATLPEPVRRQDGSSGRLVVMAMAAGERLAD